MEEVYDKQTKSNQWVLTLTQACTYMVCTRKEKGRKIEGTREQVYFGYLPARSVCYDALQHLLPAPRASLQGTVSISVDKIRAGSFLGFIPDEPEKVHVLHVTDVRGVVFVSVPIACLNCPMCFARRARCPS